MEKGKEGFWQRDIGDYGYSLNSMSDFARLSCKAQDWERARALFDKIGDRMVPLIWKGEADFIDCRNDAYHK